MAVVKYPFGITLSWGTAVVAFALIWIAGVVATSIIVPSEATVLLAASWAGGPLWVPSVFAAYALGRKSVTLRLVLVFAIVEAIAVWWANGIIRYF
jgi:hypothetical protein